jgi:DNA-binding response OmpR family regulator
VFERVDAGRRSTAASRQNIKTAATQGKTTLESNTDITPTVLIVDDEPDVADAHALKLRNDYETRVAYGGEEALETVDYDVDAVLLDRRMPDIHGDEVLERIREEGYNCKVIMTTAVDPDLNILEMDFDDYLCKPIHKETLLTTLEQQIDTSQTRDPRLDEFFSVVSKVDVLEQELSPTERKTNEEYQEAKQRANELGKELGKSIDDFGEIVDTYQDISRSTS